MTEQTVKVIGSSMIPFILPGSALIVKRAYVDQLRRGDVICYIDDGFCGTAHRVIEVVRQSGDTRLWVRGDAHQLSEEIPASSVVFVVRRVAMGPMSYLCDSRTGRLIARVAISDRPMEKITRHLLQRIWMGIHRIRVLMKQAH